MASRPRIARVSALSLAAAGALCGLGYYAISYPGSQVFGPTLVAPPRPNQIALTFDDGPNPVATPRLLDVLARGNIRASFFLIGNFARREPRLTRRIAAEGHLIGNHTLNHRWLPRLSSVRIQEEIAGCNRILEDLLGTPVRFFRPPHGARRPAVLRAAAALGLKTTMWNLIVEDWKPQSAERLLARLERGIAGHRRRARGTNVVLHDGGQAALGEPRLPTVRAVELLLERRPDASSFVTPANWTAPASSHSPGLPSLRIATDGLLGSLHSRR